MNSIPKYGRDIWKFVLTVSKIEFEWSISSLSVQFRFASRSLRSHLELLKMNLREGLLCFGRKSVEQRITANVSVMANAIGAAEGTPIGFLWSMYWSWLVEFSDTRHRGAFKRAIRHSDFRIVDFLIKLR